VGSIALAGILTLAAVGLWIDGKGHDLNAFLLDAGGYVATAALVLGLPALAYAMVTDRSIDALTASARERMRESVKEVLDKASVRSLNPDGYDVQLFLPNPARTRLLPAYDPSERGPQEGWNIDPRAPQAVTGSAWVANDYYFLQGRQLSESELRLTPDQRQRNSDLTGVAATPVQDVSGQPIAVLTIFSTSQDPRMDTDDFLNVHVGLADEVGHILRAYIGPLDFATVTVSEADARNLASGRIQITDEVVKQARNSKAFDALRNEIGTPAVSSPQVDDAELE
jgi:hypothetical protein